MVVQLYEEKQTFKEKLFNEIKDVYILFPFSFVC